MGSARDYEVRLEVFEGPLDLLLHLIRKNELDIFDIPITIITEQYLEYLDMMKALNISIAGDFLVMAATLIHIKSKMLLPPVPGEEDDSEDPRMEITRPLMEYMQFKDAAGELSERDVLDRDVFSRRPSVDDLAEYRTREPVVNVNLFQLMDAFKRVLERQVPGAQLSFRAEGWSVKEKMSYIMDRLKEGPLFFTRLFEEKLDLSELVATFLALLELVHNGLIGVSQNDIDSDILLEGLFRESEDGSLG